MAANVAPATVKTNLGVLRAVLNAAVDAELIARSPGSQREGHHSWRPEASHADPEELERLASAVPARYRALILAAGVCGFRWSELVGLRVGHIDFLGRVATVSGTIAEVGGRHVVADPKSRTSSRTLALPPFLVEELARHLRDHRPGASADDLVFTGPKGAPLRRSFAARVFNPAVTAAALPGDLTFHGLRHVATSLMVQSGEHPRVIQHRLGHATARLSMELYAHVPEAADRAAAQHLDAAFSAGSGTGVARPGSQDVG